MATHSQFEHDHTELVKHSRWYAIQGYWSTGRRHHKRFIALVPVSRYKDPELFRPHQHGARKSSTYFSKDTHQWYDQTTTS